MPASEERALWGRGAQASARERPRTANLVHVLEGQAEGQLEGALGLAHLVERLDQRGALVPGHLGRGELEHVLAVEARDGDEVDGVLWVVQLVADLLQVDAELLLDLVVAGLGPGDRVHLVDGDNHLLHAERVGKQGVLARLAVLGDGGLELAASGGDAKHGNIGLSTRSAALRARKANTRSS